ncbi:hypothetical protein F4678DRAFT_272094 [Xylaria arbuscula]|nr:hypothetical protein F4678DRAFT_272094 [Xylaria arbuscula]
MSGYLHGMSVEVGHCSNLVVVQNTNAVLDAITGLTAAITELTAAVTNMEATLRAEMRTMETNLRAEIQTIETNLRTEMKSLGSTLELRIEDMDFNGRARIMNSAAPMAELPLRPLRNTTTHETVAGSSGAER